MWVVWMKGKLCQSWWGGEKKERRKCFVSDGSSVGFVETIENDLENLREKGVDARIASGGGRMYVTMDRYEVRNNIYKFQNHADPLGDCIILYEQFAVCYFLLL